jgi:hypothetical protein
MGVLDIWAGQRTKQRALVDGREDRQHSIRAARRSLVGRGGIIGMGVLDIWAGQRTKQRALVDGREEDQQPSKCNIVNNQPEMLMWQRLPL